MGPRLNIWRSKEAERRWLSLLIDAMERASRPEVRALPCDGAILKALRAQLAQPLSHHPYAVSPSSLRN